MKKFLLFVMLCAIGMIVPEEMMANVYNADHLKITTSDDGKTVTIASEQASALWSLLNHGDDQIKTDVVTAIKAAKEAGSKIVFNGEFSGDDLNALSSNQCCVAETVDMSEARFKQHIELTDYSWIYKEPDGGFQEGDISYRDGTFYEYKMVDGTLTPVSTDHPCFPSVDRLTACTGNFRNEGECAMAIGDDGKPHMFQCRLDPSAGYTYRWFQLNSDNAYDKMSFKNWGANVKIAKTSKYVEPTDIWPTDLTSGCSNLAELTLSSGNVTSLGGTMPSTKVTIGNKVVELGNALFLGGSFPSVEFESGGSDPLIFRESCFQRCEQITSVNIPARATLIETKAFDNCSRLSSVAFEPATSQMDPLIIKFQAFDNCKAIRDVYVYVRPANKYLVCEYNAFHFETMDGQSQVSAYGTMATLHFDSDDSNYYRGDWKEGVGLSQQELMAIRGEDVHTDNVSNLGITPLNSALLVNQTTNVPIEYSATDNDGYEKGYKKSQRPANGWQQFAKTGNEIPITGNFIRSYSRYNPVEMPTYGTSKQPVVKIYRIWKFDDGYKDGDVVSAANTVEKKAFAKEITGYIPGGTGVIMVGITSTDVLYNFKAYQGEARQYPFTKDTTLETANESEDNLLEGNPNSDVTLGPTIKEGGQIAYRIFGFTASDKGFWRAMPGTILSKNHAYLKLNPNWFHWENEKNGASSGIEGGTSTSKISFIYSLDEEDEFGGVATIIRKAIENADSAEGDYYTLQGVKVSRPTVKGVYIHNGKKVLVK